MKNKTNRILLGSLVILSFLSIGCGAAPVITEPPPPPPPVDDDILALAPRQANAVLWIDMVELRKSKLFEGLKTFLGDESLPFWGESDVVNPIEQSEEILFVFANGIQDNSDQLLILIKGQFNSSDIIAHTKSLPSAREQKLGTLSVVKTEKSTLFAPTDRTVAIGTEELLVKAGALASREGKNLRDNPTFEDLSLEGTKTIQFRYMVGAAAPDLKSLGAGTPFIDIDSVVSMEGEASLGDGLSLSIKMITPTQLSASKMAREINQTRTKLGKNMFVMLLGVDWILDKIAVASEQTEVSVSLNLDGRDLEEIIKLAARLAKIRELAGGEAQGVGIPGTEPRPVEKAPTPEQKIAN